MVIYMYISVYMELKQYSGSSRSIGSNPPPSTGQQPNHLLKQKIRFFCFRGEDGCRP